MILINFIAENIRFLRIYKSLSQAEFADELGITTGQLYTYEKGRTEPKRIVLQRLATMTGLDVETIKTVKLTPKIIEEWPHRKKETLVAEKSESSLVLYEPNEPYELKDIGRLIEIIASKQRTIEILTKQLETLQNKITKLEAEALGNVRHSG